MGKKSGINSRESFRKLVTLGSWPLVIAGSLHALGATADLFGLGMSAPNCDRARSAMEDSLIVLVDLLSGNVSLWTAYLGFNVSHGLGVAFLGLNSLLTIKNRFEMVQGFQAILIISVVFSLLLLSLSISTWFYLPIFVTSWSSVCYLFALLRFQQMKSDTRFDDLEPRNT